MKDCSPENACEDTSVEAWSKGSPRLISVCLNCTLADCDDNSPKCLVLQGVRAYYRRSSRKWRKAHPERAKEVWDRARKKRDKGKQAGYYRKHYKEHEEERKAYRRAYYLKHKK